MGYLAGMIIVLSLEVSVGDLCVYSINDPIVALGEGRSMLGLRQDVLGAQVDAFLGVRYAEPPVGERRFRAAVSVDQSWQGVQRATEFGNACWQSYSAVPDNFTGHVWWTTADRRSEDCLFLNVWTPYPRPTKAPVFVFIHGGSFRVGSSSTLLYRGDTLAAVENCVVVSMNYRLGSFGFSAFYTDKEPGNLGLMDQTLALQWVKDHIKYFGGDPKRVTLIGHSAGAAGVGFHLLSPMSRNLFQRAILQSGAPNTPWAIAHKSEALQAVGKMAKELNCPSWYEAEHVEHEAIVEDTLSCLRQREPEGFFTSNWRVPIPSSVVVDGKFLLDNPLSLLLNTSLTRNKVPILIGTVDEEATLSIPFPEFDSVADISDVHQSYDTLYKNHINSLFPYTKESIQDAIDFQYRNWLDPDNGTLLHRSVIELWEDYCMVCPIREFAKYYAMTGNDVYAYNFDRQPTNSLYPEWMGILHADELIFTMGRALYEEEMLTEAEKLFGRAVMKYWANFGRTGNPNESKDMRIDLQNWPKLTPHNMLYLTLNPSIVQHNASVRPYGRVRQCAFWSHLVPALADDVKMPLGFHPLFLGDLFVDAKGD